MTIPFKDLHLGYLFEWKGGVFLKIRRPADKVNAALFAEKVDGFWQLTNPQLQTVFLPGEQVTPVEMSFRKCTAKEVAQRSN